jgi:CspA family cold shock protein
MPPIVPFTIAIIIGILAGGLFAGQQQDAFFSFDALTCSAFAAVSLISALLTRAMTPVGLVAAPSTTSGTSTPNTSTSTRSSGKKPAATGNREQGVVKWFNYTKGFGFITRDSGDDIFVHFKSIRGEGDGKRGLREGQRVDFNVSQGDKGLQADDVVVTE